MTGLDITKRPTPIDGIFRNNMDWALDDSSEILPVSCSVGPVSVLTAPTIPRWVFPATPRAVGDFDYGIMTKPQAITANSDCVLPYYQRNTNDLPKDFMLASKMLSIHDPWEEARESKL